MASHCRVLLHLVLWATLLWSVSCKERSVDLDLLLTPTSSYIHYYSGYLRTAPGMIDLSYLTFETTSDAADMTLGDDDLELYGDDDVFPSSSTSSSTQEESIVDVVVFRLPDECFFHPKSWTDVTQFYFGDSGTNGNPTDDCDWTELGVGGRTSDGTLRWCCSKDAIDFGLCNEEESGRLILNQQLFAGSHRFITIPGTGDMKKSINAGIQASLKGEYNIVFANCNDDNGRDVLVKGEIDGFGSSAFDDVADHFEEAFSPFNKDGDCGWNDFMSLTSRIEALGDDNDNNGFPPLANVLGLLRLSPTCSDREQQMMRSALSQFEQCSGYDILEVIKGLLSSLAGVVQKCLTSLTSLEDLKTFNVTKQCAESMFGRHPLGQALRDLLLHSGTTSQCYADLAQQVPLCTLDFLWPFPIDGKHIQVGGCVLAKVEKIWMDLCVESLHGLDQCLPNSQDFAPGLMSTSKCEAIKEECSDTDSFFSTFLMLLPDNLVGMPLPSKCQEQAVGTLVERYDTFRDHCVPSGKQFWEQSDNSATPALKTMVGFLTRSDDGAVEEMQEQGTVSLATPQEPPMQQEEQKPGGQHGLFVFGMLAGVLVVGLAHLVYQKRRRHSGKTMTWQDLVGFDASYAPTDSTDDVL